MNGGFNYRPPCTYYYWRRFIMNVGADVDLVNFICVFVSKNTMKVAWQGAFYDFSGLFRLA